MQRVLRQQGGLKNQRNHPAFWTRLSGNHAVLPDSLCFSLVTYPSLLITASANHAAFQENTPPVRQPRAFIGRAQYPGIFAAQPSLSAANSRIYCAGHNSPYWRRDEYVSPSHGHILPGNCPKTMPFRTRLFTLRMFPCAQPHHHNPISCGKQPEHPRKIGLFITIFLDQC